jgi:hypothetical protein
MGCDIHIFLETKHKDRSHWYSFTREPINPGRNYKLFTVLSNVRGQCDEPLSTPGWPKDTSWSVNHWNFLQISKSEVPQEREVSKERAEQWVKDKASKYIYDRYGNPAGVTHPNWHSHGHCDVATMAKALRKAKESYPYWKALLAAARVFEKDDYDVRFLFAYDN